MLTIHHKVHSSAVPTTITDQAVILQAVCEAIETNNLPMLRLIAYDNSAAMSRNREAIAQYDKLYIEQWYVNLEIKMLDGMLSYIVDNTNNLVPESLLLTPAIKTRPADYKPFQLELKRFYPPCGLVLISGSLDQQAKKFEEEATTSCYILNVSNSSERGKFYFFDFILGTFTPIPLEQAITQTLLEEFYTGIEPIEPTVAYKNLTEEQLSVITQLTLHTIPDRSQEFVQRCNAIIGGQNKNLFDTLNESLAVRRTSPFLQAVIYAGLQAVMPYYLKDIRYFSSINWLVKQGESYSLIEPASLAATDLSHYRRLHAFTQIFSRLISDILFDEQPVVDEKTYEYIKGIEQLNRKAKALQLEKYKLEEKLNTLASRLKLCETQMMQNAENKNEVTALLDTFVIAAPEYQVACSSLPNCGFLALSVPPHSLAWDILATSHSLTQYYAVYNEQWFYIDVTKRKWLELPTGERSNITITIMLKCEHDLTHRGRDYSYVGFTNYGKIQNIEPIEDLLQHKSALHEITQFAHRLLAMKVADWNKLALDNGLNVLQHAIANERRELALFIVQQPGVDIFSLNGSGLSVLNTASPTSKSTIVDYLFSEIERDINIEISPEQADPRARSSKFRCLGIDIH